MTEHSLDELKREFCFKILLVTATDLETENLHKHIKPLIAKNAIIRVFNKSNTYYCGIFGHYEIVHVQCAMGSISRSSSIMTINDALHDFDFKVVIMIGIAFGLDSVKQNIGDLIVSKSVFPYDVKRHGALEIVSRGSEALSSKILLNRIENIKIGWKHRSSGNKKDNEVYVTKVLSGESLVDNIDFRDQLKTIAPTSMGGEMEGIGLHAACDGKADWILIKGICDFADGNKSKNKKRNQTKAITAAISLSTKLFESSTAFSSFEINPVQIKDKSTDILDSEDVLFDIYSLKCESYFVPREIDANLKNNNTTKHIWIHGQSGTGKSISVQRYLLQNNKEFTSIDLSSSANKKTEEIFYDIYTQLIYKIEGNYEFRKSKSLSENIESIVSLIKKHFANKSHFIYVDEIPLSNDTEGKRLLNQIYSLIIRLKNENDIKNVQFIFSTLFNPKNCIDNSQKKLYTHTTFYELLEWTAVHKSQLIDLVNSNLKITLSKDEIDELSLCSNARTIKYCYRNILLDGNANKKENQFLYIIKETKKDLEA